MSFPTPSKKQARLMWFSLTALALAIVLMLIGLFLWGMGWVLHRLSAVLLPVGVALVLAYILDPVVEFFMRKKISRMWSVTLVFTLVILVTAGLLGSVLPGIVRESRKLANDLPNLVERAQGKAEHFLQTSPIAKWLPAGWEFSLTPAANTNQPPSTNDTTNLETFLNPSPATNIVTAPSTNQASGGTNAVHTVNGKEEGEPQFGEKVMPAVTGALVVAARWLTAQLTKVSTWAEFLIGLLLVPVYLFYFLLEKDGIAKQWSDYLPLKESPIKNEVVFCLNAINDCMIVFFRGQVLVALCVGVLLTIGYSIMGLNYSLLLGIVAGVLGIVPYLGTITSLALALTVAAVQFGDWTHPLIVFAIAAGVKVLEDFVISPRIIGERAGLHPLTVIIAVMVGTTLLGGFLGAMLAIPLTAALRTLMFRYVWNRGKGDAPETEDD